MKSLINSLYTGADGLKKMLCLFTAALYIGLTVYGGGTVFEILLFAAVMIVYIWLPGKAWSFALKGNKMFSGMDLAKEILLGTGFFCGVYCVAMRLHIKALLIAAPLVFALGGVIILLRNRNDFKVNKLKPDQWLLVLLFLGLLLLYTFTTVIKAAKPAAVGDTLLSADMLWNIGNANSFTLRFIPEDIRYSGVQLHYHYLTELFAGAVCWLTGISAYNIVAFYMQPWVLVCVVYCLYTFGKIWFEDQTKAIMFSYSMFVFGCGSISTCFLSGYSSFYNDNAKHIITNINAQSTATIFLCIFGGMFVQLLKKRFDVGLFEFALWFASFFMLCFAKGPVAAIVAIGGSITILWLFVQKKVNFKGLLGAVVIAVMFFVIYTLFFASGANTSMKINMWVTSWKTTFGAYVDPLKLQVAKPVWWAITAVVLVADVIMYAPAQMVMYLAGLGGDIKTLFKLNGKRLWANSMVAGGFMAYYLFDHYAMSQVYFAFLAVFFLHIIAIENLHLLKNKHLAKIATAAGCVAVATTVFMYVNFVGSGARFLARNMGIIEKYPYSTVVTADDQLAMEYMAENSRENSLFATNRIHSAKNKKDGISNIYSAFSGRQSYMEGYAYALTNMGVPYYVIDQRQVINEKLFNGETSPEELKYLCEKTGITHLVYSAQFDGSEAVIESVFEKIYDSETVRIYATGVQPLANHPLYQEDLIEYGEGIKD